jgi:ketosteroid isomerase-like protein
MTKPHFLYIVAALTAVSALAGCAHSRPFESSDLRGAEPETSALHTQVKRLDDQLSAAFNAHDLERLMALFSPDLEFYHDVDGLQLFDVVKPAFGALFSQNNGVKRQLVSGSLRVYPIAKYGAIELGTHQFCHDENSRKVCGTFQFVHIWRQVAGDWKLARVVSYGH